MKKSKQVVVLGSAMLLFITGNSAFSRENFPDHSTTNSTTKALASGCSPASSIVDLDFNNVRAKIISGGDMWWDFTNAGYEVPKGSGKNSIYAGSLWIGGIDAASQLKIAAQTYRQSGNDYYPGPLSSAATTDAATCMAYDKLWKLNKTDVAAYHNWVVSGSVGPMPVTTAAEQAILDWPTVGPEGQPLAPFHDSNGDGFYDPTVGDYPAFRIDASSPACASNLLYGDQSVWWVFNDAGNTHSETGGAAIGLEIQAQAFSYATSDDLNNATFYQYKIINKSSFALNNTYFGQWVDPDLGSYNDDYVGCDVSRGLGYCYNGNAIDGVYGANPPAVGVDFLEGPFATPDFIDNPANDVPGSYINYGDGVADNEHLGMSKFVYYNNDASNYGNPTTAANYYNYLKGIWKDNSPITYGNDGHTGTQACNYMFPGTTDPVGFGLGGTYTTPVSMPNWSEDSIPNPPGDRRFLQSAGPFTMQAGAVNVVFTAVLWAQASGGPEASRQALFAEDNAAQSLFNNCFAVNTATGINYQPSTDVSVKVYPNPFYDKATISFEKENGEVYQLNIYDLNGKLVRKYVDVAADVTIYKQELRSGAYMYSLSNSKKIVSNGKFIIR